MLEPPASSVAPPPPVDSPRPAPPAAARQAPSRTPPAAAPRSVPAKPLPGLRSRLLFTLLIMALAISGLVAFWVRGQQQRLASELLLARYTALADLGAAAWEQATAQKLPLVARDKLLHGLARFPEVRSASLHTSQGVLLCSYTRDPGTPVGNPPAQAQFSLSEGRLVLVRRVALDAGSTGLLRIEAEPPPPPPASPHFLLGLLGGSSVLAVLGAFFAPAYLFRPLRDLATRIEGLASRGPAPGAPVLAAASCSDPLIRPLLLAVERLLQRGQEKESALARLRSQVGHDQAAARFILECLPVGVCSVSYEPDGRVNRYANEARQRITGLDGSADSKSTASFLSLVHPEDRPREAAQRERIRLGETDGFSLEQRLLRADGSVVWVVHSHHRIEHPDGTVQELTYLVDVTALKHAQEISLREQARLRFILESMPVGISSAILGQDGRLTRYVNAAQVRITGLSPEEHALAAASARLVHPDDAAREAALRERLRLGEIDRFSLEKRLLRPDGAVVWVVHAYQRQDYADGTLEELSTFVDVTELRQARERSEREQARLRFILESMPVGIFSSILGRDGRLARYVNAAQVRITGLSPEEHAQAAALVRLVHPEDAEREAALRERLRRGEIDRFSLEKRLLRPDGSLVWVVHAYQRQDYADGTLEELSTLVDVTEQRRVQDEFLRQQARFRFIFESLPVGVDWMLLDEPTSRIVNPAHARITGVPSDQADRPELELSATHPEDRARQEQLEAELRSGRIDRYTLEKRYLRTDGAPGWAEFNLRLHPDPVTGRAQRIGTLVDLDQRKRDQAEIERMHRQLLDTSRQAGMAEVATGVLHNVGNVLNSVNVSCTLVSDQIRRSKAPNLSKLVALVEPHAADLADFLSTDPKGKMVLPYLTTLSAALAEEQKTALVEVENLRRNIEHIKEIVTMQQEYAKAGGVTETISVPDLVEDALRMNAGSLARHDVDVARDYQARPVVTLDKNQILQILINLIRNAKYACDESGRPDKLITIRVTADDHSVCIAIIDNGVGIPPENLTRIFAHGFTTRKTGHGFGLHSGALAAKNLGGSLVARSEGSGLGATFELTLPFTLPDASA